MVVAKVLQGRSTETHLWTDPRERINEMRPDTMNNVKNKETEVTGAFSTGS